MTSVISGKHEKSGELNLAKVRVEGSNPFARSNSDKQPPSGGFFVACENPSFAL